MITPKTTIWDVPFRIALIGAAGSGKTSLLVNLVASPLFYGKDFKGDNIYIVSGSLENDVKIQKLVEFKEIPEDNLFDRFAESEVQVLYDFVKEMVHEELKNKKDIERRLIIFDDVSFGGGLNGAKFGVVSEIACNCRKLNVSVIFTSQKYSHISTAVRANLNGAVFFNQSNRELELIQTDFDYSDSKKDFTKGFREATKERFQFLVVNMTNPRKELYSASFQRYLEL